MRLATCGVSDRVESTEMRSLGDTPQCNRTVRPKNGGTESDIMGKPDLILSKSRRNQRDVHGRAMAWIRRMPGYEPIEYQPRDEDGEVRRMESWIHNLSTVIQAVEQDLADGKTVMALASCEYMLRPLINPHFPYQLILPVSNPPLSSSRVSSVGRSGRMHNPPCRRQRVPSRGLCGSCWRRLLE